MQYEEIYSDKILDLVSIGKLPTKFNEANGDFIKIEIFNSKRVESIGTVYSNRLLLKYPESENRYHLGNYHYHADDDTELKFCSGKTHTDNSICNLKAFPTGDMDEPLDPSVNYKKQFVIYRDEDNSIYVKPNDILNLMNLSKDKYKLKIHFVRDVKSVIGRFLSLMDNNLIENGNFFAGLEATQTGDIDRSSGKNNFARLLNPGFSPFVLEQSGLPGNHYSMRVTGIEKNTSYVFSCWVAWNNEFNGGDGIVGFNIKEGENPGGVIQPPNTTLRGSFMVDDSDRILSAKQLGKLQWYRLYSLVSTSDTHNGSIYISLGLSNGSDTFPASTKPLGRRYFTDLRFERVDSLTGEPIHTYLNKLKGEINMDTLTRYPDMNTTPIEPSPLTPHIDHMDTLYEPAESAQIAADSISDINLENLIQNTLFVAEGEKSEEVNQMMKKGGKIKKARKRRK